MEVDGSLVVGLGDDIGQQQTAGQVPAHLAGDVVPLGGGDHGVLVGVLLGQLLVLVAQQGQDGLVGGVGLAHQGPVIAVDDIGFGQVELVLLHQPLLHQVLDILHQHPGAFEGLDAVDHRVDAVTGQPLLGGYRCIGLLYGTDDLAPVVIDDVSVSLDDFHGAHSSQILSLVQKTRAKYMENGGKAAAGKICWDPLGVPELKYTTLCLVCKLCGSTISCVRPLYKNQAIQYVFVRPISLQTPGPVEFGVIFPVVADGKKV